MDDVRSFPRKPKEFPSGSPNHLRSKLNAWDHIGTSAAPKDSYLLSLASALDRKSATIMERLGPAWDGDPNPLTPGFDRISQRPNSHSIRHPSPGEDRIPILSIVSEKEIAGNPGPQQSLAHWQTVAQAERSPTLATIQARRRTQPTEPGAPADQAEFPFASTDLCGSMIRTVLCRPPQQLTLLRRLEMTLLQHMQAARFGALKKVRPDRAISRSALLRALGLAIPEQLSLFEWFPNLAGIARSRGQAAMFEMIRQRMAVRYPRPTSPKPRFKFVAALSGEERANVPGGWQSPQVTVASSQAAGGTDRLLRNRAGKAAWGLKLDPAQSLSLLREVVRLVHQSYACLKHSLRRAWAMRNLWPLELAFRCCRALLPRNDVGSEGES